MQTFFSWSGDKSRDVATILSDWIKCVVPGIEPVISTKTMTHGAIWFSELTSKLTTSPIGIICVSQENKEHPWILFEAGALASRSPSILYVFLIDLEPEDLKGQPLYHYHCTTASKSNVWTLITTLNGRLGSASHNEELLKIGFKNKWPQFEKRFKKAIENKFTKGAETNADQANQQIPTLLAEAKTECILDNAQSESVASKSLIKPQISPIPHQSTVRNKDTAPIYFTLNSGEGTAGGLILSGKSSDQSIVPDQNIFFGGIKDKRVMIISPARNAFGLVTISVTARNENVASDPSSFRLSIIGVNHPPTISSIPDQTIEQNETLTGITFMVSDIETLAPFLVVSASSSNPILVPKNNILTSAGGLNRTLAIIPTPGKSGASTITVTVTDEDGATASTSFTLTVNPVHQPPQIGPIANQTIAENLSLGPIPLPVVLGDSPNVVLQATSSRPNLVPQTGILLTESEGKFTYSITPAKSSWGTATITIIATDDQGGSSSQSFEFTVFPVQKIS